MNSSIRPTGTATSPALTHQSSEYALVALAVLAVRCRSAVKRDGRDREIELIPEPEAPTRLVVQLARLLAGLRRIGARDEQAWRIVRKVALDSIPDLRRNVLEQVVAEEQDHGEHREPPATTQPGQCDEPAKTSQRTTSSRVQPAARRQRRHVVGIAVAIEALERNRMVEPNNLSRNVRRHTSKFTDHCSG